MKKKIIVGLMVIFFIVFNINAVMANTLNIQITLPNNFTRLNTQDSETSSYYEENQIYLHAINDEQNESIIIAKFDSEFTTQVVNLKNLSEEDFLDFMQQYKDSKVQENVTILKQEKYENEEFIFINIIFEQTTNENRVQTEEYYTIIDGSAVIISASFLNNDVDTEMVKQVIDSIIINNDDENVLVENMYKWIIPVFFLLVVCIYFIKEKKYKVQLEESDKKRVLEQVTSYMKKGDYQRFKGFLILFTATIVLNVINLTYGTIQIAKQNTLVMQLGLANKIYVYLLMLQNVIQLFGIIYIAYRLTQKESKTIKHIKKAFIIMLIGISIIWVICIFIQGVILNNSNFATYVKEKIELLCRSYIYIAIWYCYFANSIRVSVCYNDKSIEQIIMEPKKGYQTRTINKKIMEVKIIEYFKSKKAYDYASGIYINKLPKEYANSLSLSDLTSKKIIKLKKAKYYLNKKYL